MGKQHSPAWSCKATINKFLIDLQPKSIPEIIRFIKDTENRDVREDFLSVILEGDPILYSCTEDSRWELNLKDYPAHSDAYQILLESPKALTFLQLAKKVGARLPKQQKNQIVLNLEKDDRFFCIDNRKWTLAEKTDVADAVYEHLKNSDESITEKKLLRIIGNQLNLEPEQILFDPQSYGDKRFYKEKADRWQLTERRKKVKPAQVNVDSPKRRKVEAIALPKERLDAVEALFSEESPYLTIQDMLADVFDTKPEDDDYETLEISLIKALRKASNFISLSLKDLEWSQDSLLPESIKSPPELEIGKRIRITTWLEYRDQDYMANEGFAEDEMLLESAVEERMGVVKDNMQIERILSAFEYEHGILFLRPCDRPFFPEKPTYLRCDFYDELNVRRSAFLNNKHGFISGLKDWYDSIENPFAARFSISGNPETAEYHLLYKRETESFHQIPEDQLEKLKALWEKVKTEGMKTTEIALEIMRLHTHGIDRKRLYWEINAVRFTPLRTIYGILSYFQCFEKRKGSDRWYLNEKLIPNGPAPEHAEFLESRTKPRLGEWLMSPKSADRFENIINTFKDWEGREAYFAFHERTQTLARDKVEKIAARRLTSEKDLTTFSDNISDLFYSINWRKNDPDSGCWNLVLINTDRWGIFESVEAANHFVDLLQAFTDSDDVETLDQALSDFIDLGMRGIQSATLSPALFCLQPNLYSVVNKSIAVGFERLTGLPMSTDLVDYMTVNQMLREFMERYDLYDFSDVDGFFGHCMSGRLELETYEVFMKIPPIKRAMDLLIGEYDDEEEDAVEEQVEDVVDAPQIDKALKERIDALGHKLFSTDELHSDLARQLMEIRIQSIWKAGDIGQNFDSFLQTNYSLPQKGRFISPRNVIDFMVKMIAPKLTEKTIDIGMGTGGYLLAVARFYQKQFNSADIKLLENDAIKISLPDESSMVFATNQIDDDTDINSPDGQQKLFSYIISQNLTGIENDSVSFEAARLNMELNHFESCNLIMADALDKKAAISGVGANIFDVVVGTPPSTPGLTKKFIKEYMRLLKPNGRLVFLAATDEVSDKRIPSLKRDLFKKAAVVAQVRLPDWDEDKYGPRSTILMIQNGMKTKNVFKIDVDNLDALEDHIEDFLTDYAAK